MSTPPLPPLPPAPRPGRSSCLGLAIGFGIVGLVILALLVFAISKIPNQATPDDSHKSVVGTAYIGEWHQNDNPSIIRIMPDGSASCYIVHGISNYTINGGRATFNRETRELAIKFFFLGPIWHVDEAPHQTADGLIMKLDGNTFHRVDSYSSPSETEGSKAAI